MTFHAAKDEPLLPVAIAQHVETIVGLDNYPLFSSGAVRTQTAEPGRAAQRDVHRQPEAGRLRQGLRPDPAVPQGRRGPGADDGIITLASMRASDATHFWSRVVKIKTKSNRIRLDNIDGGSGRVSAALGSDETTLDVEQSGALAPQACDRGVPGAEQRRRRHRRLRHGCQPGHGRHRVQQLGRVRDVLAAGDMAGTAPPALIQANDEFLLELAAQGQANFTASGDAGAYAASADLGSTNLSVRNTADSPWTTAAGGDHAARHDPGVQPDELAVVNVRVPSQRAWGWDWQWPYYSLFLCNIGTRRGRPSSSASEWAVRDPGRRRRGRRVQRRRGAARATSAGWQGHRQLSRRCRT